MSEQPRFDRLALDHAIWVLSDYMTEAIKRKRKGDLAVANLEISSALRDLVTHVAKKAAADACRRLREREQAEPATLYRCLGRWWPSRREAEKNGAHPGNIEESRVRLTKRGVADFLNAQEEQS